MAIKMSDSTRNKVVEIATKIEFSVIERAPGVDMREKNVALLHQPTGKTIYLRKEIGQEQDGGFKRIQIALHPSDFFELDASTSAGILVAINRDTQTNEFKTWSWETFPPVPGANTFLGKCFDVSSFAALHELLTLIDTTFRRATIPAKVATVESSTNLNGDPREGTLHEGEQDCSNEVDNVDLGPGFERDPKIRKTIEQYAMNHAAAHYSKEYEVKVLGKPFDLLCTRGNEEIHVEVKGTRGAGASVIVTRNEITDARASNWQSDLYIVHGIQLDEIDGINVASGGTVHHTRNWSPLNEHLEAITFSYAVPRP